jgi:hypothetical protein
LPDGGLPLLVSPEEQVIERLTERFRKEKGFELTLYPDNQNTPDYLSDLQQIKGATE